MVSVNFPPESEHISAKDRLDKEIANKKATDQKPSVIIDLLDDEQPYKVIEEEKELVDIVSDNEKENTAPCSPMAHQTPSKGPMTPPEPDRYDPFDPTVSPDNEPESLPADPPPPATPPLQPSTPPDDAPSPTKFMSSSPNQNLSPSRKLSSSPPLIQPASSKKR